MTARTTSSRKAKGRRAAQEVKSMMHLAAGSRLEDADITVTSSSVTGEDLWLSPRARGIFPLVCEVKNQEALNFWDAIRQAEGHVSAGDIRWPVVFFKRNNQKMRVIVDAEYFLKLLSACYTDL